MITANKSLGQHWLTDEPTLEMICAAGKVTPSDTVLEIGPGPGSLTKILTAKAGQVIAVEFDEKLARELPRKLSSKNVTVVHQDILQFDLTALPANYKVIANIPYYLTGNLLRQLLESANPPTITVLLVQKEVAERIAARPGNMSLLSVSAQLFAEVSLGTVVPASFFIPPPKVDSQIVILKRREKPLFDITDSKLFFRIVKAGFSARRKTILNSLSGGLRLNKADTLTWLERSGVEPGRRAQTLSLEDWYSLYRNIP